MELAFAKEHSRLKTTSAPPAPTHEVFHCIQAAYNLLSAPLDTLPAKIAAIDHKDADITYNTPSPTPTSPSEPPVMTTPAQHPVPSYLGAVLNTNSREHATPVITPYRSLAPPSPTVVIQQPLQTSQRA